MYSLLALPFLLQLVEPLCADAQYNSKKTTENVDPLTEGFLVPSDLSDRLYSGPGGMLMIDNSLDVSTTFNPDFDSEQDGEPLPPLEAELQFHGGSYLYQPEGDRLGWPSEECNHDFQLLRLSEGWSKPRPLTFFQEFLGADPVHDRPGLKWFSEERFQWDPRFVGYGSYELFGIVLEDGGRRGDGIGHQLLIDLDMRLTGTERFHAQFRPLGRKNTGGSFFRLNDPASYDDNSTAIPDRYWFEGEFFSIFAGLLGDQFTPRDYHFVVGKFPFALHNNLLMNDDILGIVVNKNTVPLSITSNLNIQFFAGLDDVDNVQTSSPTVVGTHATVDYRHMFLEATYAALTDSGSDAQYAAGSVTKFFGPLTLAGRVLDKWGDDNGSGDGQLYVLESNFTRRFSDQFECLTGIEHGVFYTNLFKATGGWNSISGGNFDRLRSTFEINPLVNISQSPNPTDSIGAALGVQLFRHHEDESIIPELAYEERDGEPVWGISLRYLCKVGRRTFLDARGVRSWSDDPLHEREGIFVSTTLVF